jgi:phosphoribosyl 1,2-cyclic phosphodiesterase
MGRKDVRVFSLGSGSSGNAFLIDTGDAAFMLDCGVGVRVIRRALQDLDLTGRLDAIILSHEHVDHVRALKSILRTERCPVYATAGTFAAVGMPDGAVPIQRGSRVTLGAATVTTVAVPHDGAEPCGFVVESGGETLALFTDLGRPTQEVADAVQVADYVVLESNYDEAMLRRSTYPRYLKLRIQGPAGHLSNDDCAGLLVDYAAYRARGVWLAHLSDNNNAPDVAEYTTRSALSANGRHLPVLALPRYDWIELDLNGSQPIYQAPLSM